MAKIARATQTVFGTTGLTPTAGFAAAANGTTTTEVGSSNTPANIMTGQATAWAAGWLAATLGASKFPAIEDMNGVHNVVTSQLAYLFQQGIAEWDSGTTYNIGSFCCAVGTTQLYTSVGNANLNNALGSAVSNANWTYLGDLAQLRIGLTGNSSFYVTTAGNDSTGFGTAGSPWLTIQHAISYIANFIDLKGFVATINVADGTYTAPTVLSQPFVGGGVTNVIVKGNTGTPSNVLINTTTGSAFTALYPGSGFLVQDLKITTSGSTSYAGLSATDNSEIQFTNIVFGAISGPQITANNGGIVRCNGNYTINGAAPSHINCKTNGIFLCISETVTITGTPAFSTAFAIAADGAQLDVEGNTYSGSATGTRFAVSNNAVINTNGAGATYLPGNGAGTGTNSGTTPFGLYA